MQIRQQVKRKMPPAAAEPAGVVLAAASCERDARAGLDCSLGTAIQSRSFSAQRTQGKRKQFESTRF